MLNLSQLMEIASATEAVDYATIRKSLPIAYLLESHGYNVISGSGGLKSICPFHEDSTPSLSVYGNDLEIFGCWSCPARGDAVDMLKLFEPELVGEDGKDTPALFRRVRELITEVIDANWTGPSGPGEQKPFDIHGAEEIVEASQNEVKYERIQEFVTFKRQQRGESAWAYSPVYLVEEWDVGTYGNWLIIPYWDEEKNLIAYKRWTTPEKPRVAPVGSSFVGHLYGEWKEDTGLDILLCEGESDVWKAHYQVGERYRVLGLPTGVQTPTAPAERMAGRTVLLAFDGDAPGRGAAERWTEALENAGASVRVVPIPEGSDLSTADNLDILLAQARPAVRPPQGITATNGGYVKTLGRGDTQSISNWVFVPERGLHGDGTSAFEGHLRPGGDHAVLRAVDLSSDSRTTKWAAQHNRSWYGNSRDSRILLGVIQAAEVFLPSGRLVTVAGLHKGTCVWPGGQIGPEPITYVPPVDDADLEKALKIAPGPWSTDLIHTLRDIQDHKVTDPMLAWMAAAPLRSLLERFPFIAVSGAHGSGKTETTETLIRGFSGSWIQNTFKSTPHAISTSAASTNADIVQWEEYRPEGRKDTLTAGEQLLREAYTQQASQKGGMGANWAELSEIIPSAPIVVTGEDMMAEGSHVERMIPIQMSPEGQNKVLFEHVRETGTDGFPYAYRTWLHSLLMSGALSMENIVVEPYGPSTLATRQRYNLGVIKFGWGLLKAFMAEYNDNLGEPDFSAVIKALTESNKHTPIEEAINWCLGEPDAGWFCKLTKEGKVRVQVDGLYVFLQDSRRSMLFTLPGRVPAIRNYLMTRLGGEVVVENMREFIEFDYSRIER